MFLALVLRLVSAGSAGTPAEPQVVAAASTILEVRAAADRIRALPLSGPTHGERSKEEIDAAVSHQLVARVRALLDLERLVSGMGEADAGRTEALVLLALALEAFGTDLRGAYVPIYLTPKERREYQLELAERAWPQEAKALQVWQVVLDASAGSGGSPAGGTADTQAQAAAAIARLRAKDRTKGKKD